jgi:hypothetical protein
LNGSVLGKHFTEGNEYNEDKVDLMLRYTRDSKSWMVRSSLALLAHRKFRIDFENSNICAASLVTNSRSIDK